MGFHEAFIYSAEHGLFFESLIYLNKYKNIVEIGTANATTTNYLCNGAKKTGGHVTAFDIWDTHGLKNQFGALCPMEEAVNYMKSTGHDNWTFVRQNTLSQEFKDCINNMGLIDFAFIDGCHSYSGVKNDFDIIYPKLSPVGTIVFHDTLRIDGCREFMIDLRTKFNDGTYDVIDFPHGNGDRRCGISMLVKRSFPIINEPCDEVCNLDDHREVIYQKEKDWYANELLISSRS